jgi:hypothetical protein
MDMKRHIRWLKTVKLLITKAEWKNSEPPKPAETRRVTFGQGRETSVNVHGSRITISGYGDLTAHIIEGEHYEFIDQN